MRVRRLLSECCPKDVVPKTVGDAEINVLEFVMDLMVYVQFTNPPAAKTKMMMNVMERAVHEVTGHHPRPESHEIAGL